VTSRDSDPLSPERDAPPATPSPTETGAGDGPAGVRAEVSGIVQGVGFRPWVYRLAVEHGLGGRIWNHSAGVTIEVWGRGPALTAFLDALRHTPPPAARIEHIALSPLPPDRPMTGTFAIVESEADADRRVSIPPDLALCDDCRREVFDPQDRRYQYAFTNCTNCGPRFTIVRDVPYDRARTTMAAFELCDDCRREYQAPGDRRFHAEPNACGVCGPRLSVLGGNGERLEVIDPVEMATRAIAAGLIVAIKGLGGFHLACDATNGRVVARLRERKQRDEKPFAVMVASLDEARRVARLEAPDIAMLTGPERPIVLVERRRASGIAANVAPRNRLLGLMLPYTPLHAMLTARAGMPIVLTSANPSDEPLAYANDEAVERLAGIADLFLVHDRDIVAPCDDSVVRTLAGRPTWLRRARGAVPRPIRLRLDAPRPILATGALLKNTFCLVQGREAWMGPHIGDLDNLATHRFFHESVARLSRFLDITPAVVAHDLHPEYASTAYARSLEGVVRIGVQHHHAHVAAVMAEHHLEGPVLGLAWDGTGYGPDGTAWGGELLQADLAGFERLATFRPIRLAGGDRAVSEVWRAALALVLDAFGDGQPPLDRRPFQQRRRREVRVVADLVTRGIQAPLAHGVGRYFDAIGALVLGLDRAAFEGQVALALDLAAARGSHGRYPFSIDTGVAPWQVDLRETTRAVVVDLIRRRGAPVIAARFHDTLVAAAAALVRRAIEERGPLPVVLSGGCFQNARLTEGVVRALEPLVPVYVHRRVPPGDGGLALGQAAVAASSAILSACIRGTTSTSTITS